MEEAPVVVDLNVLLASILKPLGYTSSHLIQLYMKGRRLHIPAYTREEFERVAAETTRRKGLNPRTLISKFNSILNLLREVGVEEYREYIKEAEEIVNDPKDAPYVALALYLAG
ncbi:MAG: PIN domain-containing protein [Desulfurococcales archaeon]|nr:PIN domain-containing protein [Desulfurococcales archaeon]